MGSVGLTGDTEGGNAEEEVGGDAEVTEESEAAGAPKDGKSSSKATIG
jgi:hypothetical protein